MRIDDVTLRALKNEHKRLTAKEVAAKKEYDEYMNIHNELIAIRKDFADVIKIKPLEKQLPELSKLTKRSEKAERIMKKDLSKLIEKHSAAKSDLWECSDALSIAEFRARK